MSDRTEREIGVLVRDLKRVERRINALSKAFELLVLELRHVLKRTPPKPPKLAGIFSQGADMSSTQLVVTIPTTRTDGSALDPTTLASVTYQKVPAGSAAGTAPVTLQTNSASGGQGLAPTDLTFTDSSAAVGDSYTAFVTDTAGNASAASNAFVNAAATPPLAAPSAPGLTGTFTA